MLSLDTDFVYSDVFLIQRLFQKALMSTLMSTCLETVSRRRPVLLAVDENYLQTPFVHCLRRINARCMQSNVNLTEQS